MELRTDLETESEGPPARKTTPEELKRMDGLELMMDSIGHSPDVPAAVSHDGLLPCSCGLQAQLSTDGMESCWWIDCPCGESLGAQFDRDMVAARWNVRMRKRRAANAVNPTVIQQAMITDTITPEEPNGHASPSQPENEAIPELPAEVYAVDTKSWRFRRAYLRECLKYPFHFFRAAPVSHWHKLFSSTHRVARACAVTACTLEKSENMWTRSALRSRLVALMRSRQNS